MNKNDLLIRQLCEDVADLKRRVAAMPVVVSPYQPGPVYVRVSGGNVLDNGVSGIKYSASLIASVPSLYDPNVTSSFIDGIGRGQLIKGGVLQTGYVLIVNDSRSTWGNAYIVSGSGDILVSSGAVSISGPGGYVLAYSGV